MSILGDDYFISYQYSLVYNIILLNTGTNIYYYYDKIYSIFIISGYTESSGAIPIRSRC